MVFPVVLGTCKRPFGETSDNQAPAAHRVADCRRPRRLPHLPTRLTMQPTVVQAILVVVGVCPWRCTGGQFKDISRMTSVGHVPVVFTSTASSWRLAARAAHRAGGTIGTVAHDVQLTVGTVGLAAGAARLAAFKMAEDLVLGLPQHRRFRYPHEEGAAAEERAAERRADHLPELAMSSRSSERAQRHVGSAWSESRRRARPRGDPSPRPRYARGAHADDRALPGSPRCGVTCARISADIRVNNISDTFRERPRERAEPSEMRAMCGESRGRRSQWLAHSVLS